MATEIRVPTLGESVSEATIGKWFKKPGDAVKADEPLVELETDKVTLEVNAPAAGVLGEIVAKEGETVGVSALLGTIAAGDGKAAAAPAKPAAEAPKPAAAAPAAAAPATKAADSGPAVARLAAESGVDPSKVAASGKDGRVTKGDMLAAIATGPAVAAAAPAAPVQVRAPSAPDDASREERVKMTKLRQTIARRLKEAQTNAAMLTTFNEVDMTNVMALRNQYKDVFEKKHGVKLGFMGFFVKACVQALKEIPAVNAEIDGTDIVYKNYYHIGVAVGTDKGLCRAGGARCRRTLHRRRSRRKSASSAAAPATASPQDRGDAGRHVHHLERRRLRLADVDADPERTAVGDPGHAQDPGAADGRWRPDRDPPDDVSRAELRSPHHRRQGGRDLPRPRQGGLEDPARLVLDL
jgi:pyruvate/2-oxoglutarate dehydrogenase complex dihydrolipoamide acyltransferase (E2) component